MDFSRHFMDDCAHWSDPCTRLIAASDAAADNLKYLWIACITFHANLHPSWFLSALWIVIVTPTLWKTRMGICSQCRTDTWVTNWRNSPLIPLQPSESNTWGSTYHVQCKCKDAQWNVCFAIMTGVTTSTKAVTTIAVDPDVKLGGVALNRPYIYRLRL